MRDAIAWTLTIFAAAIAIPAQCLMFLAEWVGDRADEWIE
jgi:HAMP domain-containing protein